MLINKRPIISWLIEPHDSKSPLNIEMPNVSIPFNYGALRSYFCLLEQIRNEDRPDWGLPELVMPSFVEVMRKSQPAFEKILPELIKEFSASHECGILLYNNKFTIVYGFGGNELHLWRFVEHKGKSIFNFYTCNKYVNGNFGVGIKSSILHDDTLFNGPIEKRQNELAFIGNFIVLYLAVKKYVKVESFIIHKGKSTNLDKTPLEYNEKKIINYLGQEVIVMDSRWFRKIVNENDIYVRGFWRLQNKKNKSGEWYKELIFVNPFVRHGYHRNAKIEDVIE